MSPKTPKPHKTTIFYLFMFVCTKDDVSSISQISYSCRSHRGRLATNAASRLFAGISFHFAAQRRRLRWNSSTSFFHRQPRYSSSSFRWGAGGPPQQSFYATVSIARSASPTLFQIGSCSSYQCFGSLVQDYAPHRCCCLSKYSLACSMTVLTHHPASGRALLWGYLPNFVQVSSCDILCDAWQLHYWFRMLSRDRATPMSASTT